MHMRADILDSDFADLQLGELAGKVVHRLSSPRRTIHRRVPRPMG